MDSNGMTYEDWCKQSKRLVAIAQQYNVWRERAKLTLLTNLAPRIGTLSRQFYKGCGFHYSLEQELGYLVSKLSLPIQWDANSRDRVRNERLSMLVAQTRVRMLFKSVAKAEISVTD